MRRALQAILAAHAQQYPAMGPRDAVKLLYENEFGGGHLIVNPERSLEGLRTEYAATLHDPAAPLWENIGNGMVRIHLGALDCSEYPLEALNRDFVRSAELRRGSMNVFFRKLNLLRELTREVVVELINKYDIETQEELAAQVGVRRETIMRLEKAQYNPSLKLAIDISRAVDTPIEEIFIFPH